MALSRQATLTIIYLSFRAKTLLCRLLILPRLTPAEIMAPVANGLTGLWSLVTGVLTEYNLFPYVAIAVLAAIVAGLMHLGK